MDYILVAIFVIIVLMVVAIAVAMLATAVFLLLACLGTGWVAWRMLPFRRRLQSMRSPVERLTDLYVDGRIEIDEFERRVERVLRSKARHA